MLGLDDVKRALLVLPLMMLGCDGSDGAPDLTKEAASAAAADASADDGTDVCADQDWYGDGACDTFCLLPDPDCFCGGFGDLGCEAGLECVDDPTDDCDPETQNYDCAGTCQPPPSPPAPQFCGGFGDIGCPDGLECVDDPSDDCDLTTGNADCGGLCVLAP
jgi:hypothetical protein